MGNIDRIRHVLARGSSLESAVAELLEAGEQFDSIAETIGEFRRQEEVGTVDLARPQKLDDLREFRDQIEYLELLFRGTNSVGGGVSAYEQAEAAQRTLCRADVRLYGNGRAADHLESALDKLGIKSPRSEAAPASHDELTAETRTGPGTAGGAAPLMLYADDEFDLDRCLELNRLAVDGNFAFLPYRNTELAVNIGPLVLPRKTACFACFLQRWNSVPTNSAIQSGSRASGLRLPLGVDLMALDILKYVTGLSEPLSRGRLVRLHLVSGTLGVHAVLRVPRCETCGRSTELPPRSIWDKASAVPKSGG